MAKIIDTRQSDGQLVILGDAVVLPIANTNTLPMISGSIRYNPDIDGVQYLSNTTGNWVSVDASAIVSSESSTTYTLALTDRYIRCDNGSAITVTIPTNASIPIPVNTMIYIEQKGAGQVTISPASGVTLNYLATHQNKTSGQYSVVNMIKVDTNTWTLFGMLA